MKDALIHYGLSAAILGLSLTCKETANSLPDQNFDISPTVTTRTLSEVKYPIVPSVRVYETPTVPVISSERAKYSSTSTAVALATQERHSLLYGSPLPRPTPDRISILRDGSRSSDTEFKIVELIRQPGRTVSSRHDREVSGTFCTPKFIGKTTVLDCQTQYRDTTIYEIDGPDEIARVEQCQDLGTVIECTSTPLYISDEVYRRLHVGQLVDQTSLGRYATQDSTYTSRMHEYPQKNEKPEKVIIERIPK